MYEGKNLDSLKKEELQRLQGNIQNTMLLIQQLKKSQTNSQ